MAQTIKLDKMKSEHFIDSPKESENYKMIEDNIRALQKKYSQDQEKTATPAELQLNEKRSSIPKNMQHQNTEDRRNHALEGLESNKRNNIDDIVDDDDEDKDSDFSRDNQCNNFDNIIDQVLNGGDFTGNKKKPGENQSVPKNSAIINQPLQQNHPNTIEKQNSFDMPFDLRSQKQSSCDTPNTLKSSNNEIEHILTKNNQNPNKTRSSERDDTMKDSSPNESRTMPNDTL